LRRVVWTIFTFTYRWLFAWCVVFIVGCDRRLLLGLRIRTGPIPLCCPSTAIGAACMVHLWAASNRSRSRWMFKWCRKGWFPVCVGGLPVRWSLWTSLFWKCRSSTWTWGWRRRGVWGISLLSNRTFRRWETQARTWRCFSLWNDHENPGTSASYSRRVLCFMLPVSWNGTLKGTGRDLAFCITGWSRVLIDQCGSCRWLRRQGWAWVLFWRRCDGVGWWPVCYRCIAIL
jgi:hypothetical protein